MFNQAQVQLITGVNKATLDPARVYKVIGTKIFSLKGASEQGHGCSNLIDIPASKGIIQIEFKLEDKSGLLPFGTA